MSMNMSRIIRSFVFAVYLVVLAAPVAHAQGEAAKTPGLLDMFLLGLIIFLLVRMFRRRVGRWNRPDDEHRHDDADNGAGESRTPDRYDNARATWDMLSGNESERTSVTTPTGSASGFDEFEFLEGAKLFYHRFTEAAYSGDWDSIASFIDFDLLVDLRNDPELSQRGRTEIMLLEARVADVQEKGGTTRVSVFFDVKLRMGETGDRQAVKREVWEFYRPDNTPGALWTLDAVNTVDQ
jgi:predicted lipid-binding transport protein (Tim44 family)